MIKKFSDPGGEDADLHGLRGGELFRRQPRARSHSEGKKVFAVAKSLTLSEGGDRCAGRHRCCRRRRDLLPRLRQSLRL